MLIGGGIVAGLLLGYFFVVEPLMNLRADLAAQISEKHAQLEGEARLVTRAAALRSERDSLRQRLKVEREKLLPGESTTLAQAALQERVNTLANEKKVAVQSVQVLRDEPVDPFVRVAIRVTLSGEIRPLGEMLAGLEFGKTQILVPFIEMNRRGAVPGAKGPRPLSATVEASGFILARAAEAPAEGEPGAAEGGPAAAGGEMPAEAEGVPPAEGLPPAEGAPPAEGGPPVAAPLSDTPAAEGVVPPAPGVPATMPPDSPPVPSPGAMPPSSPAPPSATPPAAAPTTVPPAPQPEGIIDGTAPPPVPPGPVPSPAPEVR
jgi:hypothetical protein